MIKTFTLNLYIFLLISLLVSACSSEPEISVPAKVYSSSTEREFELIEKNDLRVSPPFQSTTQPIKKKPVALVKKEPTKQVISESETLSQLSSKNQERMLEINQNLAFFCMKHRKDGKFTSEEHCLAFTKKVLNACEKKHKLINTVMANCIKDNLKKRQ